MNDKSTASPVGQFRIGDKFYFHNIYCSDDDRIECTDEDGRVLITYTANCDVLDASGKRIGRWSMVDREWKYTADSFSMLCGHDLLAAEVLVSKLLIQSGDIA